MSINASPCAAKEKLNLRYRQNQSLVCVGLDSDHTKIPSRFLDSATPQYDFNRWIIDQTHHYALAYKPNMAFYEARGDQGLRELKLTMEYLQSNHPEIVTICDAKRADIGSTNQGYITSIFDWFGFDAVTLNPYLGKEALEPFLSRTDKISIILCRTSNPGSGEFQDLLVGTQQLPLWMIVAQTVAASWNRADNCMLVVGATYPDEMSQVRRLAPQISLLVPGVGAQGGDLAAVVEAGLTAQHDGIIINSSRGIIFADDPSAEAKLLYEQIRAEVAKFS